MPSITMGPFADIEQMVRDLKVERDTWQAVALQYRTAFETQTRRLQELQDICFATQAELENERAKRRRQLDASSKTHGNQRPGTADGVNDLQHETSSGTTVVRSPRKIDSDRRPQSSDDCINPLFKRVQQSVEQQNYGTALVEVERLLRGPLSSKARAEGLLLKSNVLRASGPDELYDALAACSEALELCDRLSELEKFLPRIQYQRGVLYYELRMLHQAREAFSMIGEDELLSARASEYRRSCDDELDQLRVAKRRSGFDENRTTSEGLLAHLEEKDLDVSVVGDSVSANAAALLITRQKRRRRTSAQLRQYAAAKAKRMSLPHRWVVSKSDGN